MAYLSPYSQVPTLICLSILVTNMTHILSHNDDSTNEYNCISAPFAPLITAVLHNDSKKVESLLNSKTNVNDSNGKGMTALLAASITGNERIAEVLLNHKAHADQKDIFGTTPIIVAQKFLNMTLLHILQRALKAQQNSAHTIIKSNL